MQEIGASTHYLYRHIVFLGIGFVFMFLMMAFDYRLLQRWAKPLLLISVMLLILLLVPGISREISGARRWFHVGPINFQPSELVKITMLIYTADYLVRKKNKLTFLVEGFLPLMLVVGFICLLIVKQPDLGSAILIAGVVITLLFIAGTKIEFLAGMLIMIAPALYYLIFHVAYRMRRIIAFLDPWQDSQGAGFQLTQSQIALGTGGITGVGLGKSMQKLFYLPAAHTDFIFSIIGEEFGLLGTLAVIFLFIFFIWQGARIVKRISNPFGYYVALGIVLLIGFQAAINIGVSIGVLPTKGLPLPFISYGGSALIFNMAAIGLFLNISRLEDL